MTSYLISRLLLFIEDTMQNIFISQLYSVTGYVNAVNDRVKSNDDDDEYRDPPLIMIKDLSTMSRTNKNQSSGKTGQYSTNSFLGS